MSGLCDPFVGAESRFPLQRAADHIRSTAWCSEVHPAQPAAAGSYSRPTSSWYTLC